MLKKEISKILPYYGIDPATGWILNGNGDISKAYKMYVPDVFTMDAEDFNRINDEFTNALRNLPINSCLHFIGMYWPSTYEANFGGVDSYTIKCDLKHWHLKPVMMSYEYLVLTFSERDSKPQGTAVSPSLYTSADYIFGNKPFRALKKANVYRDAFETFESLVNSINDVSLSAMSATDATGLIYKYLTFDFEAGEHDWMNNVPPIMVDKRSIHVGENELMCIGLLREGTEVATFVDNPGVKTKTRYGNSAEVRLPVSYVYPIGMGLPVKHILNVSVEIVNNEIVKSLYANDFALTIAANIGVRKAKERIRAREAFVSLMSEKELQAVNTGINVIVSGKTAQELDNAVNLTKTAFSKMNGAVALVENMMAFPAFMFSLPGNRRDYEGTNLAVLEIGACYIPKETHAKGDSEGFYYQDRFGKPVAVNFWDNDLCTNRNMAIIGPSGSGKSYWANGFLHKSAAVGNHIVIIDVGHSYQRTCAQLKGRYFNSDDKATLGNNIFSIPTTGHADIDAEVLLDKKNLIFSVLKFIWKETSEITTNQKQVLRDLINQFLEEKQTPKNVAGFYKMVSDYNKELDKHDMLREYFDFHGFLMVLKPFVDGEYAWVFEDKGIDIDHEKFIVFSLQSIKNDKLLYPIFSMVLVDQIIGKIKRLPLGVRKSFFIDEAWDIFRGDLKGFVEYLFRTVRKENAQVAVITQNANDINTSGIGDAIRINTDIKIMLKHPPINDNSRREIVTALGMTTRDLNLLSQVQKKEFLVKFGDKSFVFLNEASPQSHYLFTTDAAEVANLNDIKEAMGGDDIVAINELVVHSM